MSFSENQLDTWSSQGSVTQSAATYQTVSNVLNDKDSPFWLKSFDTFLQGSYGNDTNIYADSDVDIVIRLTSIYYSDISDLPPLDKANYELSRSSAEYTLPKFKDEVTNWLTQKFGPGVKAGSKAIFIPGNGSRRDADVLPCAEHRHFLTFPANGGVKYYDGIVFWAKDGTKIVNYPKQHSANCTLKHQNTNTYFKRTVRIFKNMRNRMIDEGRLAGGVAPSYFIEGLLFNVPNQLFGSTYWKTVNNCIEYVSRADTSQFRCANGIHWLLRDGHPVCWSLQNFQTFMSALKKFWA
ncbi:nucleotidyltransferase domain-containing protein [Rhizobium bangladeshense]|uniref:nucleotidyltransferase domain-containing protein n=1 Tax=Rhizobium bangladeshense TaxID=1138189 RepID=UPI001C83457A|nr:nucleotidyltransferase [Rhizobium bangladeshense]MBX4898852.1 nucleotidyltransferase [Rhizobium bangladeshense]MBY3616948.1 nucleotidyltransferase [Rhizobium bangladeshense]